MREHIFPLRSMREHIRDLEARQEGTYLESVGTWLNNDGMTYPVYADDTVQLPDPNASAVVQYQQAHDEGYRLEDIDPNGEGEYWWNSLSLADRVTVQQFQKNRLVK